MMDDSVNSFVNIALRKTDLESFMFSQEGNIWNNIILKVQAGVGQVQRDLWLFPRWIKSTWQVAGM